ncbi:MAG: acetate uptake transporter [Pseudonocardia sp.]|uniref:acetate uptake transporter n=1 Tax=Pseudonocardia sp. TaxID=60912 RepID=UPI001AC522C5|nr:acetate uptake transporter [Pseudonocardia sp.]MBN9102271.1 acetate uptake transporter [Pseudonocardia sp.]
MSSSVEDRQHGAHFVEEPLEQRAVSPADHVADPGPLGLAAFATTTFVLSAFNAGMVPKTLEAVVLPLALFYGGTAQLLAGMWEFKKANTFGAVAFTSYGAFWLSFAAYVKFIAPGLPAAGAGTATGLFLLAWTIFTAYMTVASLRTTGAIAAVFVVLLATLILLVFGTLGGSAGAGQIGGYLGLVTAFLAWYASAAGVVNATWKRSVLPVMPLS